MNPDSRFQPLERPRVAPGCCFICKGNNGPYVDTALNIPWEGGIIICKGCIIAMHSQLDLPVILNEEELRIRENDAYQRGFIVGADETRKAVEDAVSSVVIPGYEPPAPSSNVTSSVEEHDGTPEDDGGQQQSSNSPDGSLDEGFSLIGLVGRDDVPSNSGNGAAGRDLPII